MKLELLLLLLLFFFLYHRFYCGFSRCSSSKLTLLVIPVRNSANCFFQALNGDAFFFEPVHGGVLSISSVNLFAIGMPLGFAIGFIFLLFFMLGSLPPPPPPPPSMNKNEKDEANGNVNGNANGNKISTTYT